ncbi:MAG: hypothetical protein OXL41_04185 [Nitrospinae bacterium]|nr:hypothetical protein [Nitrospinota bacterium]
MDVKFQFGHYATAKPSSTISDNMNVCKKLPKEIEHWTLASSQ